MEDQTRRRKRHTISRKGCGNCKLRRVKCDEVKPGCLKCRRNGLLCNYATNVAELSSLHEQGSPQPVLSFSDNRAVLDHMNNVIASSSDEKLFLPNLYRLDMRDLERLSRFQNRTLTSCGLPVVTDIFQREALRLMAANLHLLHIAMTLTAMHDRYLAQGGHLERTPQECYHWNVALQSFTQELSHNFNKCDLDAIWLTASLMFLVSFFAVETDGHEQVWPLKPTGASDLTWLEMQKGMRALWPIVDLERDGSLFRGQTMPLNRRCLGVPLPTEGIDDILPFIAALCGLDQSSNANNSPYYSAAQMLSLLFCDDADRFQPLRFLAFPNMMVPEFEVLVKKKDPYALVMMALWYELIVETSWWMSGRAALECKAIWIYLNRNHADKPRIKPFLTRPDFHSRGLHMMVTAGSARDYQFITDTSQLVSQKLYSQGQC